MPHGNSPRGPLVDGPHGGDGKWGRLPKRVIEQMFDNGRRKLPEKYRIILEEYYRRLPEAE